MPLDNVKEPTILSNLRKYALIYGAGGVAALQALKTDIFSFPADWRIYLGYFFSLVTIFCIFLGGSSVIDLIKKMNVIVKKMNEIDHAITKETPPKTGEPKLVAEEKLGPVQ